MGGYAIGYDIYEGNTYEGHTLIPFLEKISRKFNLDKPVVVADAGLLSNENSKSLKENEKLAVMSPELKAKDAEKSPGTALNKWSRASS